MKLGQLIGIGILVAILGFLGWFYFGSSNTVTPTANNSSSTTTSTTTAAPITSSAVSFTAPSDPVNGRKVSVTVLGVSKVFNNLIETDGKSSKLISTEDVPQLFQLGMGDAKEVQGVVTSYLVKMQSAGVTAGRVQMVAPSSTKGNETVEKIKNQLRGKFVITDTTPEQEGNWAYKGSVATEHFATTTVVDLNPSQIRTTYSTGSVVTKTIVTTGTNPKGKTVEQAQAEFLNAFNSIPVNNRQNVIIVWAAMRDVLSCGNRYCQLAAPSSGTDINLDNGFKYLDGVQGNKIFDTQGTFALGYSMKF